MVKLIIDGQSYCSHFLLQVNFLFTLYFLAVAVVSFVSNFDVVAAGVVPTELLGFLSSGFCVAAATVSFLSLLSPLTAFFGFVSLLACFISSFPFSAVIFPSSLTVGASFLFLRWLKRFRKK